MCIRDRYAVLAAAIAYGGGEDDIQPGLDYFRQIAEQGRLDLGEFTQARIEKGEVGVAFLWDFNALGYREQFLENNPDADFTVFIPVSYTHLDVYKRQRLRNRREQHDGCGGRSGSSRKGSFRKLLCYVCGRTCL